MSKYANGVFFATPYSNISPPSTSFEMARSSSRDSTLSTSHYYPTSQPMSRCSSSNSYMASQPTSAPMRRTSSSSSSQSTWIASPYRSCLNRGTSFGPEEPSSYLADDELLCLSSFPVESLPNPCLKKAERKEMTTEEQIQHLRELQEQEERKTLQRHDSDYQSNSARRKTVRFEPEVQRKTRRPSNKRRSTACRNQLRNLNGPM
jgi:hypothetical protein